MAGLGLPHYCYWLRASLMDRSNFLWKLDAILAVLQDIYYIPLGGSFSMGPQNGVSLFKRVWEKQK